VHLNRRFREAGLIEVREELGRDMVDVGRSVAFAAADHQVAHVYVNDLDRLAQVRRIVEDTPGIAEILDDTGKRAAHIDHPRAGELVVVAEPDAWFTYYYWLDDRKAPDFSRCVDIHRKPGYDPAELFLDPQIPAVKLKILWRLLQKKLGFRMLMDVIPLDATLVKGSHGCRPARKADWPVLITDQPALIATQEIESADVYQVIKRSVE